MSRTSGLSRRAFVSACAGLTTLGPANAATPSYELVDLDVGADKRLARRCRVVFPAGAPDSSLPVLVLLHGLGETKSERLGIEAWWTPYGMADALARLRSGTVRRPGEKTLSEEETRELESSLARDGFSGMVLVCPYMPNPHAFPGGAGAMFARYGQWLRDAVLPAVRERVPCAVSSREGTGVAGVSLGGFVALELVSRAPETFSTVATVQGAFSAASAPNYARRLAELESPALRGVYVSTSWYDPYRGANERLYEALVQRGVRSRFSLRRGPHSQGWLREIGTLELLLWHDRALRTKLETGAIRAPKP